VTRWWPQIYSVTFILFYFNEIRFCASCRYILHSNRNHMPSIVYFLPVFSSCPLMNWEVEEDDRSTSNYFPIICSKSLVLYFLLTLPPFEPISLRELSDKLLFFIPSHYLILQSCVSLFSPISFVPLANCAITNSNFITRSR
jgi:hypothetical protein